MTFADAGQWLPGALMVLGSGANATVGWFIHRALKEREQEWKVDGSPSLKTLLEQEVQARKELERDLLAELKRLGVLVKSFEAAVERGNDTISKKTSETTEKVGLLHADLVGLTATVAALSKNIDEEVRRRQLVERDLWKAVHSPKSARS